MKRTLIITVLMIAVSSYAQGQSKGDKHKSLEQDLMLLQRTEDEAESKRDLATLERLLSDDFIFTAPDGAISEKSGLLKM